MNATEQKSAAKKFAEYWKNKGYERNEVYYYGKKTL